MIKDRGKKKACIEDFRHLEAISYTMFVDNLPIDDKIVAMANFLVFRGGSYTFIYIGKKECILNAFCFCLIYNLQGSTKNNRQFE